MDFFQEPTFTAFLAIILTFVLAKIVSYAVFNSHLDDNTVVYSASRKVTPNRGSRVKRAKNKRKVKFVDDVVIKRFDRYEGPENLDLLDDVEKVVEENKIEKDSERVYQSRENGVNQDLGEKITDEKCLDMSQDKGSAEVQVEIDGDGVGAFIENKKGSGTSLLKSEISDEKEGNGEVRVESDDDWEGIERSELERVFGEAVNYLEYGGKGKGNKLEKLGSDVQMELYGLHKVAVEGPCHEPPPMALKVYARSRWNAWQKLGSMSRDAAMEQYVRVLSHNIPDWMHDYSDDSDIQSAPKLEITGKISDSEFERKLELSDSSIGCSTDKDDIV